MNINFVLASASPRRSELLRRYISDFEVLPADVDERFQQGANTDRELLRIAGLKAATVSMQRPESVVIAADTVVIKNNHILGKPVNAADAERMLSFLSGTDHEVRTAVSVIYPGGGFDFVDKTVVSFYQNSNDLIKWYIATGEPFDKAGAYAIQGLGSIFVKSMQGDFNNVVGLPLARLIRTFIERGLLTLK